MNMEEFTYMISNNLFVEDVEDAQHTYRCLKMCPGTYRIDCAQKFTRVSFSSIESGLDWKIRQILKIKPN